MSAAIYGLWRNWAVAVGMLKLLTMLAPVTPRMWLAPINVLLYLALEWCRRYFRRGPVPVCSRLNRQVSVVILVTAIALVLLSIYERDGEYHELTGQVYTSASPLLSILITSPLACLVTLCFLLRRGEPETCQRCIMRYGNVIEHGFVGDLYRKEWRYQTQLLFGLSLVLSVADWWYYLRHYVNTNLNHADLFFFAWLPLAMYVCSLIYLGIRYYSLWVYYCRNDEGHYVAQPGTTTLRYLVICDDRILVDFYPTDRTFANGARVKRFDTPVVVRIPYHEKENMGEAIRCFQQATGIPDAEIKLAYDSPDNVTYQNIFHYFAFVGNEEVIADSKLRGEWLSWGNLTQMASEGILDRDFVAEIKRIYRIAMAWKTYDERGRRLYPIKHYKPTFRLSELRNWDVDFNDYSWLRVANHNEDKFWFRVARWFHWPSSLRKSTAR